MHTHNESSVLFRRTTFRHQRIPNTSKQSRFQTYRPKSRFCSRALTRTNAIPRKDNKYGPSATYIGSYTMQLQYLQPSYWCLNELRSTIPSMPNCRMNSLRLSQSHRRVRDLKTLEWFWESVTPGKASAYELLRGTIHPDVALHWSLIFCTMGWLPVGGVGTREP
jgi:hypothetical protein